MMAELTAQDSEQSRTATILKWLKPLMEDNNNNNNNNNGYRNAIYKPSFKPVSDLPDQSPSGGADALLVLLPLLIVLSTFLFLLLIFLVCILLLRRRRGILLRDNDGPVDLAREELVDGDGGFEGVESRWLENVDEEVRRSYLRAKEYQSQCPPNSLPTDITLSQFLAIQEKGVSAWSFEPDYELSPSVLVHSRTELTFLPDPSSASSVQSNLPLPKLNEVYYWEVKMFDLPQTTHASIGLATKPYPSFRLPGHSRYSVAYHSSGDKSYNYPFTQTTFGATLKEGDVLGVGYRPRTGTVFFTRNGRKLEDAFVGLTRWNLFPTIGANGPCSLHINLGQSGFVFIEANVKKWGLAPSVGTLAPPPAYGAERGSILLEAGGGRIPTSPPPPLESPSTSSPPSPTRRLHRSRRLRHANNNLNQPVNPSPLRGPPLTPNLEESPNDSSTVLSPASDRVEGTGQQPTSPERASVSGTDSSGSSGSSRSPSRRASTSTGATAAATPIIRVVPELRIPQTRFTEDDPDSPELTPNPPTPGNTDIHMRPISGRNTPNANAGGSSTVGEDGNGNRRHSTTESSRNRRRNSDRDRRRSSSNSRPNLSLAIDDRPPPAYSPLDAYHYPDGVHVDLPAEVISAALEGAISSSNSNSNSATSPSEQRRTNSGSGSRRFGRS